MSEHTHVTVPTRFVEAQGIRYAYRRFGNDTGVPLIFLQHLRGGMDHWEPVLTDGFAQDRLQGRAIPRQQPPPHGGHARRAQLRLTVLG